METGNPKQLAVLSVMAVGAIGFLAVRLGGKSQAPTVQATALARNETKTLSTGAFAIVRDPFSHPRLAPKDTKPTLDPSANPFIVAKSTGLSGAAPGFESLPGAGGLLGGFEGPVVPVTPVASTKPEAQPEPLTTIGLEAIAGASDTIAFLSVGGADSQPFRPKDRIAGAIRLLRVGDGTVVLEGPKGRVTLEVGERRSL